MIPFPSKKLIVLEANLDDMNPEWYEPLVEQLFKAGALDVTLQPLFMKKNRPAILLQVLAPPKKRDHLLEILFRESTTLGVRSHEVERFELKRDFKKVKTPYGNVIVKIGRAASGQILNVSPEYESCRQLAKKKKVPLKKIYAEALRYK